MTDQELYDAHPEIGQLAETVYRDLTRWSDPMIGWNGRAVREAVDGYDPRGLAVRLWRDGWRKP